MLLYLCGLLIIVLLSSAFLINATKKPIMEQFDCTNLVDMENDVTTIKQEARIYIDRYYKQAKYLDDETINLIARVKKLTNKIKNHSNVQHNKAKKAGGAKYMEAAKSDPRANRDK